MTRAATTVPLLLALAWAAPAAAAGDAQQGESLARTWCSGCHLVGTAGGDAAPPLAAIARDPGRTDAYIYAWLTDPHPPMPQLDLSRQEIADLIAYLDTLRQP
jgi:cytochrome c